MVEVAAVEAAIRAWEAARAATKGARKALHEAFAVLDATVSRNATIAWDAARRAVFDAKAREEEAERAALLLMPWGVPDGAEMPVDGAEGCVVDGRFYYQLDGEIHWMKVADLPAESPTQPSEEPDDWKRCDMTCPGCKEPGHVFSRIWESSWDGYKDMRYECRNCGDAWPVPRGAP